MPGSGFKRGPCNTGKKLSVVLYNFVPISGQVIRREEHRRISFIILSFLGSTVFIKADIVSGGNFCFSGTNGRVIEDKHALKIFG